jgi:hypothetical protein
MGRMTEQLDGGRRLVLIRDAAKAVRKSERYIRKHYVDTLKVKAFRMGGTDEHPRLRIYVEDLIAAIERDAVYLPPGFKSQEQATKRRRAHSAELHPAAAAM